MLANKAGNSSQSSDSESCLKSPVLANKSLTESPNKSLTESPNKSPTGSPSKSDSLKSEPSLLKEKAEAEVKLEDEPPKPSLAQPALPTPPPPPSISIKPPSTPPPPQSIS